MTPTRTFGVVPALQFLVRPGQWHRVERGSGLEFTALGVKARSGSNENDGSFDAQKLSFGSEVGTQSALVSPAQNGPNCRHDKLAGTLQGFSAAPSGCLRGLMGLAPFPPSPKWANWQSKGGTLSLVCRNISES
jgi:hypothetical protein